MCLTPFYCFLSCIDVLSQLQTYSAGVGLRLGLVEPVNLSHDAASQMAVSMAASSGSTGCIQATPVGWSALEGSCVAFVWSDPWLVELMASRPNMLLMEEVITLKDEPDVDGALGLCTQRAASKLTWGRPAPVCHAGWLQDDRRY
mmetsp:Transcript_18014/g.30790  ORF Transcript_18014/g.30790 Transcript_18014/m.30790 type:complete len:145 (-) Transcript_18014:148-582(-)